MQNIYSEWFFKNSIKTQRSPLPVMLQTLFTRRALKALEGHLKGTHRALKGHLRTRRALGYSKNTWGLKALG